MADENYTLMDAWRELSQRLWRGQASERQSRLRLMMAIDVLGRDMPLAHIKTRDLERLAEYFEDTIIKKTGKPYTPSTVNKVLLAISKVLTYAHDNEIIDRKPKVPLRANLVVKDVYLPEDKIQEFLEEAYRLRGFDVTVALQFLMLTGLRAGELSSLSKNQLQSNHQGHFVLVRSEKNKTYKNRAIPIPEQLFLDLSQIIETGIPSYRVLYDTCVMISDNLKLDPPIRPHGLRHTFGTIMTQRGTPSLTVAKLMGHSSLATTRRYEHHSPATNPLSCLHMNIGAGGIHKGEKPLVDPQKHWRYSRKRRENSNLQICSPLRSHSATRPSMCNPLKNNESEES